mgnify:CR=1 FL=1
MYSNEGHANSQSTLVNVEAPIEFVLKLPGLFNNLLSVNGVARYRILSKDAQQWNSDVTDLRTNEIIASVRRNSFTPDTVRFPGKNGGKAIKKSKWLVRSNVKTTSQ